LSVGELRSRPEPYAGETRPKANVKTLVTSSDAALRALQDLYSWAEELHLVYAWASSADGTDEHWKSLPLDRVRRAIIGVHFARTEPLVLRVLHDRGVLRVARDAEGVFHPKMIVGTSGDRARVLIGSSNFTSGGFAANTEINLLITGRRGDAFFAQVFDFIDGLWQNPALRPPTDAWLKNYDRLFASRPAPPGSPKRPPVPAPAPPARPEESDLEVLLARIRREGERTRYTPPELALGILRLVKAHTDEGDSASHATMAKRIHVSQGYFSKLLRIMRTVLPEITEQWRARWKSLQHRPSLRVTVEEMEAVGSCPRPQQREEYEKRRRRRGDVDAAL
jgi:hypothetical protein